MTQKEAVAVFSKLAARHQAPETLTGAASENNLAAIHAFLDAGENIEEKSVGYSSPLHAAVNSGRTEAVELLLAKGASVERKPEAMSSPLSAAAAWGFNALFRRLVALAHDTSKERTALVALASYGQLDELRLLLDKGSLPDGRYAIAAAAKHGHYEVVKYLVDAGVAWKEFTLLRIPQGARDAGFTELFKYLSDQPYDETAALAAGHAARDKRLAGLKAQMATVAERQKPADPAERKSLLAMAHGAVATGALANVINQPVVPVDKWGELTPLIAAALIGDAPLVSALLAAGAKPALKLKGGVTAKGVARGPTAPAIVALLENTKAVPAKPSAVAKPAKPKAKSPKRG